MPHGGIVDIDDVMTVGPQPNDLTTHTRLTLFLIYDKWVFL